MFQKSSKINIVRPFWNIVSRGSLIAAWREKAAPTGGGGQLYTKE
jgi:hypothetical protein